MKTVRLFISESRGKVNKWSSQVHTKWHPPEGFFKQSAQKIATGLLKEAKGDKTAAIRRLSFQINRAGKNMPKEDKDNLMKAKELIRNHK